MLSSEFNQEMGALLRRLSNRIILEPMLKEQGDKDLLEHIEDAIVVLCALYIKVDTEVRK